MKHLIKIGCIALMVALCSVSIYAENVETSLILEVSNVLTGDTPTEIETFHFELFSENSPLPSSTIVEVDGTGSVCFEEIIYTAPGVYEYTLSLIDDVDDDYILTEVVYDITVYVFSDDDGVLSIGGMSAVSSETNEKSSSLTFDVVYENPLTPDTGDTTNTSLWIGCSIVSLVGILLLLVYKRKK